MTAPDELAETWRYVLCPVCEGIYDVGPGDSVVCPDGCEDES